MSQQDLPNLSMPRGFMGSHAFSWFSMLVFILLAYGLLVRGLRFRRMKELQRSFGYTSRKSLGKMTFDDAAAIHLELSEMEFPFSFLNSTEFALFRVC